LRATLGLKTRTKCSDRGGGHCFARRLGAGTARLSSADRARATGVQFLIHDDMATSAEPPFDHRAVLAQIAQDGAATAASRLRAVRLIQASEPKQARARQPPPPDETAARAVELAVEWADRPDSVPVAGSHRGVPIWKFQDQRRIKAVVQPAIDRVLDGPPDPLRLMATAGDVLQPPECRLLAAARYLAVVEERVARHQAALGGVPELMASVAGLGDAKWIDPWRYGSLLDVWQPRSPGPAKRAPKFAAEIAGT
jgi:hypothetical protein